LDGPPNLPSAETADTLDLDGIAAVVISGSFPEPTAAFWLGKARERDVPCFWDASPGADLGLVGLGGSAVYLQVSYAEHEPQSRRTPEQLAHELLVKTGAAGVVVTAAERGAYGITREDGRVLHAPAVPLEEVAEPVGCGAAHLAGFLTAFLQAP